MNVYEEEVLAEGGNWEHTQAAIHTTELESILRMHNMYRALVQDDPKFTRLGVNDKMVRLCETVMSRKNLEIASKNKNSWDNKLRQYVFISLFLLLRAVTNAFSNRVTVRNKIISMSRYHMFFKTFDSTLETGRPMIKEEEEAWELMAKSLQQHGEQTDITWTRLRIAELYNAIPNITVRERTEYIEWLANKTPGRVLSESKTDSFVSIFVRVTSRNILLFAEKCKYMCKALAYRCRAADRVNAATHGVTLTEMQSIRVKDFFERLNDGMLDSLFIEENTPDLDEVRFLCSFIATGKDDEREKHMAGLKKVLDTVDTFMSTYVKMKKGTQSTSGEDLTTEFREVGAPVHSLN